MPDNRGIVRELLWPELFPWLRLFRAFWMAADIRKLLLASLAIALTSLGWWCIDAVLAPEASLSAAAQPGELPANIWIWNQVRATPPAMLQGADGSQLWSGSIAAIEHNALWLTRPFRQLMQADQSFTTFAHGLLSAIWAILTWSVFAGAIARIAAVDFAIEERVSLRKAFRHTLGKWRALIAAPVMPLSLVLLLGLPILALGGVIWLTDAGWLIAGIAWPLVLLAGVLIAIVLFGLVPGWPLIWAAISADDADSFDALSRSYTYVFQRPLHYIFYAAICGLIGILGWIAAATFANLVFYVTTLFLSWGGAAVPAQPSSTSYFIVPSSQQLIDTLELDRIPGRGTTPSTDPSPEELSGVAGFGMAMVRFWDRCLRLAVIAFGHSFFWCSTTGIYFLLRRDADGTDLDELYLEEPEEEYELPATRTDEAGVLLVNDPQPSSTADGNGAKHATTPSVSPTATGEHRD